MTPLPKFPFSNSRFRNLITIIVLMALALPWRTTPTQAAEAPPIPSPRLLRVHAPTDADAQRLLATGVDVQEARNGADLFVLGDSQTQAMLQAQGFVVAIEEDLSERLSAPDTYYLGYRTVAEHMAHLDTIAATYPNLATVYDIGDGWRKTNGRPNGQDLKAICITGKRPGDCALNPNTDKPRFLLIASTHARELSPAEVAWRWIDYLVTQYNIDPDITALLDANEMWVIPLHNPEGRTIVESGGSAPYLQRKNTNNSMGNCAVPPTGSSQHGVDLNRNASWDWGGIGTSSDPCSVVYLGTGPASEPENKAVETLFTQLFRDQRAPDLTSPAPMTTTGLFITLHSWGNMVLVPWATDGAAAPNDSALRALGFRMSYFNSYITGRGKEVLYSTSGSTDDQTYGAFGIPSFTYEIGGGGSSSNCGGFLPAYACQDSLFWPANRGALIYAAKSARAGYATGSGPSALNVAFAISRTVAGGMLTLNALIDDNRYGNTSGSVGRPFVHAIKSAEVYIDVPPWAGGTPIAMSAVDGAFSATAENVRTTINTQGLSLGRHTVYVRGSDSSNAFGPITAQWFWVDGVTPTPTPSPTPTPDPAADVCAPVNVTANLAIPDNRTAPTCVNIPVSANGKVTNATLKLALTHTYVGDLRIQLISPSGITLTVLNRPGLPATQYGDSSNFVASAPITFASGAPYNAELMGSTLLNAQAVCRDDKRCIFAPNPDGDLASAINGFSGFSGQSATGTWRLCIADLSNRDVGTINAATLDLACVAPSVQLLPVTPEPTATPQPTQTPAVLAPDKPDDELPAAIWLPLLVAE